MRALFLNTRTVSLPIVAVTLSLSLFLLSTPRVAAQATTDSQGTVAPAASTLTPALQATYEKGQQLLKEEKYEEALELFQSVLAENSQFPPLYGMIGVTLYNLERYTEAIPFYSIVISNNFGAESAPYLYERGRCYFELKEYDLALESLEQATSRGRNSAGYHIYIHQRGKVYQEKGNISDALADFTIAVRMQPTVAEYHYSRGLAQMSLAAETAQSFDREESFRNYSSAVVSFDQAIQIQAEYPEALHQRGLAKFQIGQVDDAILDIEKAMTLEPDNPTYSQQYGFALLQQAAQAAAADPDDKATIFDLYQKAIGTISRTINISPKEGEEFDPLPLYVGRAEAMINLAEHLPEEDQNIAYQKAIEDCDFAISVDSRQPSAFFFKGLAYRMLGELEEAVDAFSQTLELSPSHVNARLRRGILWYHLGEYDLAIDDFQEPTDSTDPRPKFWAGLVHAKRGNFSKAVESYSAALQGFPRFTIAFNNRGMAYFHLGLYQRAINDFNQTIRIDRRDAVAFYRRGITQLHLDRSEEALGSFKQAIRWNPEFAKGHQALGDMYLRRGDRDMAQEHLEKAKQLRS